MFATLLQRLCLSHSVSFGFLRFPSSPSPLATDHLVESTLNSEGQGAARWLSGALQQMVHPSDFTLPSSSTAMSHGNLDVQTNECFTHKASRPFKHVLPWPSESLDVDSILNTNVLATQSMDHWALTAHNHCEPWKVTETQCDWALTALRALNHLGSQHCLTATSAAMTR